MGGIFGGRSKGPSAAEIQAQADAAAKKERDRLTAEQQVKDQAAQAKNLSDLQQQEAKRAAFSGFLSATEEEDAGRKKFLKGV
jgi:hypothetical protein